MAEGVLGALKGGEDEVVEVDAPSVGADPVAAAVAMDAARYDPALSREAGEYLRKQGRLVDIQTEHLHEQRAVQLSHLKLRRFTDRLKAGTQLFLIVVASLFGAGALLMLRDAATSHAVVIDAFKAPSALAPRGVTGEVVAGGMLDELTRLQAATHTSVSQKRLANSWSGDIKIEVPETGASIGEIGRLLRERFGHDLHVGGDLVQTEAGGIALTVRGDGVLPKTFTGGAGDLGRLTTQAAEYVYGESQPGQFGYYLGQKGRDDEAIAFAQTHLARASLPDQARLLNTWAIAIGDKGGPNADTQSLPLYREAVRIQPEFWSGWENIQDALASLGDEERGVRTGREMLKAAGGRLGKAPTFWFGSYDSAVHDLQAVRADILEGLAVRGGSGASGSSSATEMLGVADDDVSLHDVDAARHLLATIAWNPNSHNDAAAVASLRADLADEVGDAPAAATAWDDFAKSYADPSVAHWAGAALICRAAPAYEKTGQSAKADAALNAPLKAGYSGHFVDCYRFHGDVLDLRGDWVGAQAWYAKAVALAPSIPSGAYSWGMALARHGELAEAAVKFATANRAGPHWADPLKAWGDVLVREGHPRDALAKYDEALKYAPGWAALRQARRAAALNG